MYKSRYSFFIISILIAQGLVFASYAYSAPPTIYSISGTIATGQIITISGANMINEDRAKWDPFFSLSASGFEGDNLRTDGYTSGCANVSYDANVKLMGLKSIKTHTAGASNYPGYGTCPYQFRPTANVADLYFRVYSRWNANEWPNEDIKYWWLGGGGETQFLNLQPKGDGSAPTQISFYAPSVNGGNWVYGNIPGGAIQNNRWYLIEMHVRRQGNPPYVVEVWINNSRVLYTTNATAGATYNTMGWGWEANTNYWNTSSRFSSDHWQDGFVISSSRVGPASLIEVSNMNSYGQGTLKYQAPVYLSDNSSQVKLDLSGLGAGPYYIWVTNNRGERSAVYPLSGAGGESIGITPPSGLRIMN